MRILKAFPASAVVIGSATMLVLAASAPAMASSWRRADLTAITRAPAAAGDPVGYTTDLAGQGRVARVVYRTARGHIEELSTTHGRSGRRAADLTAITRAPAAAGDPVGYTTDLAGQGRVARVVYRTARGHIEELSTHGRSGWSASDLTAMTGAPAAAGDPAIYATDLAGQGPVVRVVYRTRRDHIEELYAFGHFAWSADDLTGGTGAPAAVGDPFGYTTDITGLGPVARVVYRTARGHIEELLAFGHFAWSASDLTAITGAPAAAGDPFAYTTDLTGEGPVARVVYRTHRGHIEELFAYSRFGWSASDLTAITRAPAAVGNPAGYTTHLTGQGPVAQVVYRTARGHIEELSGQDPFGWSASDLTAITRAPAAVGNPAGYTTDLTGQGTVARVVYRTARRHIEELSV